MAHSPKFPFGPCLAALAALLLLPASASAAEWSIVRATKDVSVLNSDKTWSPVESGMVLAKGATLRTGRRGRVLLKRNEESVALGPKAVISLPLSGNGGSKTFIHQLAGKATYEVEKRNVKHFSVDTPYLAAVVKGTIFSVNVRETTSKISVKRGVVEVGDYDTGQFAMVRRNQSVQTDNRERSGLTIRGSGAKTIEKRKSTTSPAARSLKTVAPLLKQATGARKTEKSQEKRTEARAKVGKKIVREWNATAGFRGSGYGQLKKTRSQRSTKISNAPVGSIAGAKDNPGNGKSTGRGGGVAKAGGNGNRHVNRDGPKLGKDRGDTKRIARADGKERGGGNKGKSKGNSDNNGKDKSGGNEKNKNKNKDKDKGSGKD